MPTHPIQRLASGEHLWKTQRLPPGAHHHVQGQAEHHEGEQGMETTGGVPGANAEQGQHVQTRCSLVL